MKKADLKQLIKPLVKECIHEVLLEEGLLSNVVAEVAKGMQGNLMMEAQQPTSQPAPRPSNNESREKINAYRAKLMNSINADAYNGVDLFEGTKPLPSEQTTAGAPNLGDAGDSGVDISSLMGNASKIWKAMK
tara:strand:+ start:483 stop:881 length:399 start_codon:yes stop_codon:yes gene_type:complete